MRVGNMACAIDHECPRYRKYPSAIGIPFLEIETGALQYVLRSIIHLEGKTELFADLAAMIDQNRKSWAFGAGVVGGSWRGLRRHRNQGGVGVRQLRSNFEQSAEIDIAV